MRELTNGITRFFFSSLLASDSGNGEALVAIISCGGSEKTLMPDWKGILSQSQFNAGGLLNATLKVRRVFGGGQQRTLRL